MTRGASPGARWPLLAPRPRGRPRHGVGVGAARARLALAAIARRGRRRSSARWPLAWTRRPRAAGRSVLLLLLPTLVQFHVAGGALNGDGVMYYVYVRSLVKDADLDFTNEYTHYGLIEREDLAVPDPHRAAAVDLLGRARPGLDPVLRRSARRSRARRRARGGPWTSRATARTT